MKRSLIALGLSALTLVGGHFFNRRWDRAVLFSVLTAYWGIGCYVGLTIWIHQVTDLESADLTALISSQWTIFWRGAVSLWLISMVVAVWDVRRGDAQPYRWSASGVTAAVGLSALMSAFVLMLTLTLFGDIQMRHSEIDEPSTALSSSDQPHFSEYLYLGGYPGGVDRDRPRPPAGSGFLRGRFLYDDKPAVGVTFSLTLNGRYETEKLITDTRGEFVLRLPIGQWSVNRVATYQWPDRPQDGSFIITTGAEPKLENGQYDKHYRLRSEGIKVAVMNSAEAPQLTVTIRKRVAIAWPPAGDQRAPTSVDKGVVAWERYPGAATYLVEIAEVTRAGNTTSYSDVTSKQVTQTTFPLSRLAALPSDDAKEYQVSVRAFSRDGAFLSESEEHFRGHVFVLTDKKELARDAEFGHLFGRLTPEEAKQLHDNNRRIGAIEVLLNDGLTAEAQRLLAKVTGKADPGRKTAITGYLMAARGRCDEANRLFAKAQSEGGANCVPNSYRAACVK